MNWKAGYFTSNTIKDEYIRTDYEMTFIKLDITIAKKGLAHGNGTVKNMKTN